MSNYEVAFLISVVAIFGFCAANVVRIWINNSINNYDIPVKKLEEELTKNVFKDQ